MAEFRSATSFLFIWLLVVHLNKYLDARTIPTAGDPASGIAGLPRMLKHAGAAPVRLPRGEQHFCRLCRSCACSLRSSALLTEEQQSLDGEREKNLY